MAQIDGINIHPFLVSVKPGEKGEHSNLGATDLAIKIAATNAHDMRHEVSLR